MKRIAELWNLFETVFIYWALLDLQAPTFLLLVLPVTYLIATVINFQHGFSEGLKGSMRGRF
jgi:hypothetical protein